MGQDEEPQLHDMSRRAFLEGVGLTAAATALSGIVLRDAPAHAQQPEFPKGTVEADVEQRLARVPEEYFEDENTQRVASMVATAIANSPHVFQFRELVKSLVTYIFDPHIQPSDVEKSEAREHADASRYTYEDDGALANIGIQHTSDGWEVMRKRVYDAIDSLKPGDILALESEEKVFVQIAEYARTKGIQVKYLESNKLAMAGICTGILVILLEDMFKKNLFKPGEMAGWLKSYGLGWIVSQLGIWPPSINVSDILAQRKGIRYQARYDVSFTFDARTVFMKLALDELKQQNPDKRIVSVTGDGHAAGISFYSQPGRNFELDVKRVIYNIVYALHKRM
jgi:hypothetical protein